MESKKIKKLNINDKNKDVFKSKKKEDLKKSLKDISEVVAKARFIKISPRKSRLIVSQVRGMNTQAALDYLKFANKAAVRPIVKLINSAIANAGNNFQIDKEDLYIKKIVANDGPVIKRWRPRAHGRATMIRKRTSHIDLVLGVKSGSKQKSNKDKKEGKKNEVKLVRPEEIKKEALKISGKNSGNVKGGKESKGFLKGVFQRKTG